MCEVEYLEYISAPPIGLAMRRGYGQQHVPPNEHSHPVFPLSANRSLNQTVVRACLPADGELSAVVVLGAALGNLQPRRRSSALRISETSACFGAGLLAGA